MSEPFLGELRIVSFSFAPRGWALCNGQLLPINQNQALFALLGTMYGGDGQTSFALPDLRGRVPVHSGGGVVQGERFGSESHVLTPAQIPGHTHAVAASNRPGASRTANGSVWAATPSVAGYSRSADATMGDAHVATAGGSQPHPNMAPFQVLNVVIALQGIFPARD